MKRILLSVCIVFLAECSAASNRVFVSGEFDLAEPICATHVGVFRDGGTVCITLEGSQQNQLDVYIDYSISTPQSHPADLGSLWINAYPKTDESKRVEFGADGAATILKLIEYSYLSYFKEQDQDWSAQKQDLLRTTIEHIERRSNIYSDDPASGLGKRYGYRDLWIPN